jgi:hypothetical protein
MVEDLTAWVVVAVAASTAEEVWAVVVAAWVVVIIKDSRSKKNS